MELQMSYNDDYEWFLIKIITKKSQESIMKLGFLYEKHMLLRK